MLAVVMSSGPGRPVNPGVLLQAQARELQPVVRAVVAAVLRQGPGHPDVEDCTGEALRRAIEGSDRLRDGEPLRPWVVGIARHVALDLLRAQKRRRVQVAVDLGNGPDSAGDVAPLVERVPDSKPNPFERVAKARRDALVREAIDALPDGARDALVKFHLEGKSYQEIAKELGVPLGTVATWVNRGRKAVAEKMEREMAS